MTLWTLFQFSPIVDYRSLNKAVRTGTTNSSPVSLRSAELESILPTTPSIVENNTNVASFVNHQSNSSDDGLKLVWLLSFPNSGTSFTMQLIQAASELAVATQHGKELDTDSSRAFPVYNHTIDGPYWKGRLVDKNGNERPPLPDKYVMTKAHCGSRCVNCPSKEYKTTLEQFTLDCMKSTARLQDTFQVHTSYVPLEKVAKVIWLMRHPLENIVSRFHLEIRNWAKKAKKDKSAAELQQHFYKNETGFRNWCNYLDETFDSEHALESEPHVPSSLWSQTPCRHEFYKYTQWHNYVAQMLEGGKGAALGDRPFMHWYYEDYDVPSGGNASTAILPVDRILGFLNQQKVGRKMKSFRTPMPIYRTTYYSLEERRRIWALLKALATNETWHRLQVYHESHLEEDSAF